MYKPFDLTGKVALVTGGNSGIGLGMARALAQAGADVAIWGTNAQKNAAAKSELLAVGGRILALECDVSDEKGRMDSVRLDLWAGSLAGRLARAGGTEVWIEGGMGATTSTEYRGIVGLQGGLRVQQQIRPELELFGRARFYGLEHDVSAFEAWGGVRAWFLVAGYRSLQFNFGPPLHGPEAGVALSF